MLKGLIKNGIIVIGVDVSGDNLRKAKDLCYLKKGRSDFIVCDLKSLPFKENTFPVICLRTIYYLEPKDRVKALHEFYRVLRKKGRLIISSVTSFYVIAHATFARITLTFNNRILELLDPGAMVPNFKFTESGLLCK